MSAKSMGFTLHGTLSYPWMALFVALLAGVTAWVVSAAVSDPGQEADGLGAFPSPLMLIIIASLVAFVVTFVAAFFRTAGWTAFVGALLVVVAVVVVWLLDWVLGKWGTVMILLAIPAALGVVVGLVMFLLFVKRSDLGIWLTAFLVVACAVLLWTSMELEATTLFLGVFIFNAAIVATMVGYKTLVTIYTVFKKWSIGA